MLTSSIIQYVLFLLAVTLLVKPGGLYLAAVFEGRWTIADPILRPVERFLHFLIGVRHGDEMGWKRYAAGIHLLLPRRNTDDLRPASLAAISSRRPGSILSCDADHPRPGREHGHQLLDHHHLAGLRRRKHNEILDTDSGVRRPEFLAGTAGLAIGIAFIRGFARRDTSLIGNFWVDLIRAVLWVLLPLSIVGSLLLIAQGVPMNSRPYASLTTVAGGTQIITQGPVAALEFIEQLGTNGGGFFNANGAHPFENPTPLTNFVEMLGIAVLPAALTYTFGVMTGRKARGWTLYAVMVFLLPLELSSSITVNAPRRRVWLSCN